MQREVVNNCSCQSPSISALYSYRREVIDQLCYSKHFPEQLNPVGDSS